MNSKALLANTRCWVWSRLACRLSSTRAAAGGVVSLNENNLIHHHMHSQQPKFTWTNYNGKIPILQQQQETPNSSNAWSETPKTSLLMELTDRVGVLHDVLKYFWKYDINISRIESRPKFFTGKGQHFDFFIDIEGSSSDENLKQLIATLGTMTERLLILDERTVEWFPRHISELDTIAGRTMDAGTDLEADHPGFHDPVYRQRRQALADAANRYSWNQSIEPVDYTDEETSVWTAVWDRMEPLLDKYACKEYLSALEHMETNCGYSRDRIPQQRDVSDYLTERTNFRMRPVAGLLSSRDFLNGLAFRVFFSTQYIRHHSKPLYTPEPDICHELLGHAPMFADRDFADFSQEIGLASLGASDEDVEKLARVCRIQFVLYKQLTNLSVQCYWHSVEFGLCRENGVNKAYGAGLLSSYGELQHACEGNSEQNRPDFKPWDPSIAARQEFPITTYQPVYFLAESLQDAKFKMRSYCETLNRPFWALYNPHTSSICIDRPIRRFEKS